MYYPYLRGRQFELIALREFAVEKGFKNNVVPIIEPVKNSFNSIKLAIPKLFENNVRFGIVLNPIVGENKNSFVNFTELREILTGNDSWIPVYIIQNNYDSIASKIEEFGHHEVMIVLTDTADTSSPELIKFIQNSPIKYVLSKENRTLKRLLPKNIELIRLDDNFNAQKRNKDYLSMAEEKFSEEHLFYKEDGYAGFSDYTVLVSDFIEGGSLPYAVAIHLTYAKPNNEVWIKHFTSITNDDQSNIQRKFAEAAKKAVLFIENKNISNSAVNELREYYNDGEGTYPGLGVVKKISIKNHLELINDLL
ncbi:MAG: sce7725 family protein [Bacteroidia bacterium]